MAHGDARERKWRGNCRMEWVASTHHTTSEHVLSSITPADAYTSAASIRLNSRPRRFKWTRLFHRKTKSGFCACAITFQTQSNDESAPLHNCSHIYMMFLGHTLLSLRRASNKSFCQQFALVRVSNWMDTLREMWTECVWKERAEEYIWT